jgi:hypothetical protein
MATVRLLTALRDHLVIAGIARDPTVAGPLPPFWRDPKLGTPAPGDGNNSTEVGTEAVIAAYLVGGTPTEPQGSWVRFPIVELRFRTTKGFLAEDMDIAICNQIHDRRDFMLGGAGGLYVVECQQILPLQRLGSDEQGWEHLSQFRFELYRPGYAGL